VPSSLQQGQWFVRDLKKWFVGGENEKEGESKKTMNVFETLIEKQSSF
jgi:hypothetical protein